MTEKEFLSFDNFVDRDFENEDWIIVARSEDVDSWREHEFTLSRLIENDDKKINKILSRCEWEVHQQFGLPKFSGWDGEVNYSTNNITDWHGIEIESFTLIRYFDEPEPPKLELVQNFIFYHNLLFVQNKNHYVDQKSNDVVVEITQNRIKIRSRYLRDYLAARNMVLVRYHDHRRHVDKPIMDIIGKEREEINKKNETRYHTIVIAQHEFPEIKTYSRLLGKDIIRPYNEPLHQNYLDIKGEEKKSESFIVGRDNSGRVIEKNCTQDGDPLEFLQIVSFKKELLKKYYDSLSKYTVNRDRVFQGHLWGIPYWIKNDRVHVYLGDLSMIPYDEQVYWKSFNVEPQEPPAKSRLDEIIENEFDGEDPIHQLIRIYEQFNKKFERTYGFKLFKDLNQKNTHVLNALHSLTSNEQKELEEQMICLAKIFVESINKKELLKMLNWIPEDEDKQKSIIYLEKFLLENLAYDEFNAKNISKAFKTIQTLRSAYSAHLISSKFNKTLEKLGLLNLSNEELSKTVILQLYRSLNSILFRI